MTRVKPPGLGPPLLPPSWLSPSLQHPWEPVSTWEVSLPRELRVGGLVNKKKGIFVNVSRLWGLGGVGGGRDGGDRDGDKDGTAMEGWGQRGGGRWGWGTRWQWDRTGMGK